MKVLRSFSRAFFSPPDRLVLSGARLSRPRRTGYGSSHKPLLRNKPWLGISRLFSLPRVFVPPFAHSLVVSIFRQTIFPENAYGVDSGGDPTAIPSLTFDYFKGFHQRFYHPGNSRVYFYGDDPPLKVR